MGSSIALQGCSARVWLIEIGLVETKLVDKVEPVVD